MNEHFEHDDCPECGEPSVPLEKVPDQSLRGCPDCGHAWFEDLHTHVKRQVRRVRAERCLAKA